MLGLGAKSTIIWEENISSNQHRHHDRWRARLVTSPSARPCIPFHRPTVSSVTRSMAACVKEVRSISFLLPPQLLAATAIN